MCFQKQAIDSLQNNQTFNIATLYSSMKYYWPYIYFEFYQLKNKQEFSTDLTILFCIILVKCTIKYHILK